MSLPDAWGGNPCPGTENVHSADKRDPDSVQLPGSCCHLSRGGRLVVAVRLLQNCTPIHRDARSPGEHLGQKTINQFPQ